jgi:hypothetical protein
VGSDERDRAANKEKKAFLFFGRAEYINNMCIYEYEIKKIDNQMYLLSLLYY